MRMVVGIVAAQAATPDYPMLRAALVAAQATTPTAQACLPAMVEGDRRAALRALFAANGTGAAFAALLGHSFGAIARLAGGAA